MLRALALTVLPRGADLLAREKRPSSTATGWRLTAVPNASAKAWKPDSRARHCPPTIRSASFQAHFVAGSVRMP